MNVLAIDTAMNACNIAVVDTDTGAAQAETRATERGQAEILVPMIDALMTRAGMHYNDLDLIAVVVGPGSFTGIRVGLAAARGYGIALGVPVQGVMTTDALYATWIAQHPDQTRAQVRINTKRGDLYAADYKSATDMPFHSPDVRVVAPHAGDGIILGDGVDLIPDYQGPVLRAADPCVVATYAARLYADTHYAGRGVADPIYVRDAEISTPKKRVVLAL